MREPEHGELQKRDRQRVAPDSCRLAENAQVGGLGPKAEETPRGQRVRFRVALTGTLLLDVPCIVIAERTEGKHG
jgi:hypothetical protein